MAQRQTYYIQLALGPTVRPLSEIPRPAPPPPPFEHDSSLLDSASPPVDYINSEAEEIRRWLASFVDSENGRSAFTIDVSRNRFLAHTPASGFGCDFIRHVGEEYGPAWWLLAVNTFLQVIRERFNEESVPVAMLSVTWDFLGLLAVGHFHVRMDFWPPVEQLVVQCNTADKIGAWPVCDEHKFEGVSRLTIELSTDALVQTSDFAKYIAIWMRDFIAKHIASWMRDCITTGAVANTLAELQVRNVEEAITRGFECLALDPYWEYRQSNDMLALSECDVSETRRVHLTFKYWVLSQCEQAPMYTYRCTGCSYE